MNKKIKLSALSAYLTVHDVPIVGITEPFYEASITRLLKEHVAEGDYVFFGDVSLEQRQNIEAVFPRCKQIIVIGLPYDSKNKGEMVGVEQAGYISNMAWQYDYHHVVYDKLSLLRTYLENHCSALGSLAQVDTGPLIDRHIAYRAGLGSYAKNQNLMHDQYGTEFYIGYLMIDQDLIEDDRVERDLPIRAAVCHQCSACVKACPAQVLGEDFSFKGQGCISYLTQKKDALRIEEMKVLGKNVYGCDVCQLVCPQNRIKKEIPAYYKRHSLNVVDLKEFIGASNKGLMRKYKATGFAWRGAKVLKRNAIVAMGHYKSTDNTPFLKDVLADKNPYLMPPTLWALYESSYEGIEDICLEILEKNEESDIKITCRHILQLLK